MQCRHCGTEIANKAIICYRCGAATTDPVRPPVELKKRRSPLLSFVAMAALLLLALYQGYAYETAANPQPVQLYIALATGLAIVVLVIRLILRRH